MTSETAKGPPKGPVGEGIGDPVAALERLSPRRLMNHVLRRPGYGQNAAVAYPSRPTHKVLAEFRGTATVRQTPDQRRRLLEYVAAEYQAGWSIRVLGELTGRSQTASRPPSTRPAWLAAAEVQSRPAPASLLSRRRWLVRGMGNSTPDGGASRVLRQRGAV